MTKILKNVIFVLLQNAAFLESQILSPFAYPNPLSQDPSFSEVYDSETVLHFSPEIIIHAVRPRKRPKWRDYGNSMEIELIQPDLTSHLTSYIGENSFNYANIFPQPMNVVPPVNNPYSYYAMQNIPSPSNVMYPNPNIMINYSDKTSIIPKQEKIIATKAVTDKVTQLPEKTTSTTTTTKSNLVVTSRAHENNEITRKAPNNKVDKPVTITLEHGGINNKYILAMRDSKLNWAPIYGPGPFPRKLIEKMATNMQYDKSENGSQHNTLSLKLFRAL